MTQLFGWRANDDAVRQAAWVARCVGRSASSPLPPADVAALAAYLEVRHVQAGGVVFPADRSQGGVWIVHAGTVELAVGSGRRRVIVQLLHPGDVDGDIQWLLSMPPPYTARAIDQTDCLFIAAASFDRLLGEHPAVAHRWPSSVASRLAAAHSRLLGLLGRPLPAQVARLLVERGGRWGGAVRAADAGGHAGRAAAVAEQDPQGPGGQGTHRAGLPQRAAAGPAWPGTPGWLGFPA